MKHSTNTYSVSDANTLFQFVQEVLKCREEVKCSICLDLMHKPLILGCCHSFCSECIETWMLQSKSCPVCNSIIQKNAIQEYFAVYGMLHFIQSVNAQLQSVFNCQVLDLANIQLIIARINKRNEPNCNEVEGSDIVPPTEANVSRKQLQKQHCYQKQSLNDKNGNSKISNIADWLNDSKNQFENVGQTQQSLAKDSQNSFDMPSVSQQKQYDKKFETTHEKIRCRKSRTKSLEVEIKKMPRPKRHSISWEKSDYDYNCDIECCSDEDVELQGVTVLQLKQMEEEILKNMEIEIDKKTVSIKGKDNSKDKWDDLKKQGKSSQGKGVKRKLKIKVSPTDSRQPIKVPRVDVKQPTVCVKELILDETTVNDVNQKDASEKLYHADTRLKSLEKNMSMSEWEEGSLRGKQSIDYVPEPPVSSNSQKQSTSLENHNKRNHLQHDDVAKAGEDSFPPTHEIDSHQKSRNVQVPTVSNAVPRNTHSEEDTFTNPTQHIIVDNPDAKHLEDCLGISNKMMAIVDSFMSFRSCSVTDKTKEDLNKLRILVNRIFDKVNFVDRILADSDNSLHTTHSVGIQTDMFASSNASVQTQPCKKLEIVHKLVQTDELPEINNEDKGNYSQKQLPLNRNSHKHTGACNDNFRSQKLNFRSTGKENRIKSAALRSDTQTSNVCQTQYNADIQQKVGKKSETLRLLEKYGTFNIINDCTAGSSNKIMCTKFHQQQILDEKQHKDDEQKSWINTTADNRKSQKKQDIDDEPNSCLNTTGNKQKSQKFKRIRTPSPDSDTEAGSSQKVPTKHLQNALSVTICSEQNDDDDDIVEKVCNVFQLSEENDDAINYSEVLENIMGRYDTKVQSKVPPKVDVRKESLPKPSSVSEPEQEIVIRRCNEIISKAERKKLNSTPKIEMVQNTATDKADACQSSSKGNSSEKVPESSQHSKEYVFNSDDIFNEHVLQVIDKDILLKAECQKLNENKVQVPVSEDKSNEFCSKVNHEEPNKKLDIQNVSKCKSVFSKSLFSSSNTEFHQDSQHEQNVPETRKAFATDMPDSFDRDIANDLLFSTVIDRESEKEISKAKPDDNNKNLINMNDKKNSNEVLSDEEVFSDDVIDSTPEKKNPLEVNTNRPAISHCVSVADIDPFSGLYSGQFSQLILPPPPSFQSEGENNLDTSHEQDVTLVSGNTSLAHELDATPEVKNVAGSLTPDLLSPKECRARINNISAMGTSTPISDKLMSQHPLSLSPIGHGLSKTPNVIECTRNDRFSPLTVVVKTSPAPTKLVPNPPKLQKSILNYIQKSQEPRKSSPKDDQELLVTKKPCVACSRLNKDQIIAITALTNKKLVTYSSSFNLNVTHMVVSTDKKNCVKDHTIKYISAIAAGIWVLNFEWVQECLRQGYIINEEPFEVLDISGVDGPRQSRLIRLQNPLLKGFKIYASPPFISTTQSEVENVVRLLGGVVVQTPQELIKDGNKCLIITEATTTQELEKYEALSEAFQVATVELEWLTRSVGQYRILSLYSYSLCSSELLSKLGYPADLISNTSSSLSQSVYTN